MRKNHFSYFSNFRLASSIVEKFGSYTTSIVRTFPAHFFRLWTSFFFLSIFSSCCCSAHSNFWVWAIINLIINKEFPSFLLKHAFSSYFYASSSAEAIKSFSKNIFLTLTENDEDWQTSTKWKWKQNLINFPCSVIHIDSLLWRSLNKTIQFIESQSFEWCCRKSFWNFPEKNYSVDFLLHRIFVCVWSLSNASDVFSVCNQELQSFQFSNMKNFSILCFPSIIERRTRREIFQ